MIRVIIQPEPAQFDALVRTPGNRFLGTTPKPTPREWNKHSYWRRILTDLRRLYGGICAYSCHWTPPDTGGKTVEHFAPKHEAPERAYEWSNYRFVCSVLNSRKATRTDTLDPFEIEDGWFVLDFPSLLVKPARHLDPETRQQVRNTIDRLKLNDEETCLENRAKYVKDYCVGGVPFSHLQREAPFLAKELERQDLVDRIREMMQFFD